MRYARLSRYDSNLHASVQLAGHSRRSQGVLGSMELLSETELTEDQLPLLRTARTCGEQLSTVINDILDLTKIQEKRIELSVEEICFRELMEDLLDITVFSLGRRKIELILDFDSSVRVTRPIWS